MAPTGCRQRNSSGGGGIRFPLQRAEILQLGAQVAAGVFFPLRLNRRQRGLILLARHFLVQQRPWRSARRGQLQPVSAASAPPRSTGACAQSNLVGRAVVRPARKGSHGRHYSSAASGRRHRFAACSGTARCRNDADRCCLCHGQCCSGPPPVGTARASGRAVVLRSRREESSCTIAGVWRACVWSTMLRFHPASSRPPPSSPAPVRRGGVAARIAVATNLQEATGGTGVFPACSPVLPCV